MAMLRDGIVDIAVTLKPARGEKLVFDRVALTPPIWCAVAITRWRDSRKCVGAT